jgi:hypothetical protein
VGLVFEWRSWSSGVGLRPASSSGLAVDDRQQRTREGLWMTRRTPFPVELRSPTGGSGTGAGAAGCPGPEGAGDSVESGPRGVKGARGSRGARGCPGTPGTLGPRAVQELGAGPGE